MSTNINVSQLLKLDPGTTRLIDIADQLEPGILGSSDKILGRVILTRTQIGILAEGALETHLESECSRCLSLFVDRCSFQVSELYVPSVDIETGWRMEVEDLSEEPFLIDSDQCLDLSEALRQYTISSIPLKPLCSVDCKGICPSCGDDLNDASCNCEPLFDKRWGPLKDLLDSRSNGQIQKRKNGI